MIVGRRGAVAPAGLGAASNIPTPPGDLIVVGIGGVLAAVTTAAFASPGAVRGQVVGV